ncbi:MULTISPECIES: efflux RND transporter periplasmic adaptor subunit [Halomonas]|uniref:efflux RND transporter periplasmic adaptor subunit n=1 Tax=Halomonas TaxID=2745 RepID=UPI001C96D914|nr:MULTISPECIES: efflux RND transporter periplasmic adaptor subunit [Halomonas]MBY6207807.1 efflux RND transporter periplasmic adaptor subunit [Halomonas sp. DP3Y7-2]MBY6228616.1 efflux RND transporter periplasmic adaptor subunit [Halomonas sp. DP3Y7-1]MCA0916682.1 efflux RND transporter periplasmic adaptor subunit [Halomonas denitrificans]
MSHLSPPRDPQVASQSPSRTLPSASIPSAGRLFLGVLGMASLGLLLAACQPSEGQSNQNASGAASEAPAVEVVEAVRQPVSNWYRYTTRLEAPERVTLRPRVTGQVADILFEEGSLVEQAQPLVRLDLAPFEARVRELEAQLARGKAEQVRANGEANRANQLVGRNLMAREEAEARRAGAQAQGAQVASLQAQLDSARLDLAHAEVTAPISGRVSRADLTVGNVVSAGQSVLTTIVSTDQVDAYFDIDERTWNRDFAAVTADQGWPVELQLAGQDEFAFEGQLDFIDNQVDEATGTLRVRARFDAAHPSLRPGAFARVRLAAARDREGVLVPDRAIGTDLDANFVLVAGDDGTLAYRKVTTGARFGAWREITEGLEGGEPVVAAGPSKFGPGMAVSPQVIDGPDRSTLQQLRQRTERLAQRLGGSSGEIADTQPAPSDEGPADALAADSAAGGDEAQERS